MSGRRIAGAYGVRGEVRLKSFCAEPEDVTAYGPLETEDGTRRFTVTLGHRSRRFAARLSGVARKEQADALRGTRLCVDRARLPLEPDEDEFYHADLIGLEVRSTPAARLAGPRAAVLNHGASDLLEVHAPGQAPCCCPSRRRRADGRLGAGRIVADPPEGLFA